MTTTNNSTTSAAHPQRQRPPFDVSQCETTEGVMLYQTQRAPHMPASSAKPKDAAFDSAEAVAAKDQASFQATLKEKESRARPMMKVYDVRPGYGQLEIDVLNGHLLLQNLSVKAAALQRLLVRCKPEGAYGGRRYETRAAAKPVELRP